MTDATDIPATDAPVVTLNKRELARAMSVSEPTVGRWIEDGCPVRAEGTNGKGYEFVLADVIAWRRAVEEAAAAEASARIAAINQMEMELTGGTVAPEELHRLSAADRAAAIKAEHAAILLAREKGLLLSREEVARDFQAMFGLLRQRLLSMPTYLARVAQLDAEKAKIVEAEMRGLLRELALQIADPTLRPQDKAHAA